MLAPSPLEKWLSRMFSSTDPNCGPRFLLQSHYNSLVEPNSMLPLPQNRLEGRHSSLGSWHPLLEPPYSSLCAVYTDQPPCRSAPYLFKMNTTKAPIDNRTLEWKGWRSLALPSVTRHGMHIKCRNETLYTRRSGRQGSPQGDAGLDGPLALHTHVRTYGALTSGSVDRFLYENGLLYSLRQR